MWLENKRGNVKVPRGESWVAHLHVGKQIWDLAEHAAVGYKTLTFMMLEG